MRSKSERLAGPPEFETQIPPELLGTACLSPFAEQSSSSRMQMFGSHVAQMGVPITGDVRQIQSGMERQAAKFTFAARMPCDAVILAVIPFYEVGAGSMGHEVIRSPGKLVIYENADTHEIDCLKIKPVVSHHQYLGYTLRETEASALLRPQSRVSKGTVFADSPAVDANGDWRYGLNANMAYMTVPAVSEDGVVVRKGFLERMGMDYIITRVIQIPRGATAVNLYGDGNRYRPFPSLGQAVRGDRLLMAYRGREDVNTNVESIHQRSEKMRRMVDPFYDQRHYAPMPGGTVINIRVDRDPTDPVDQVEHQQPLHYDAAGRRYYQTILDWYRKNKGRVISQRLNTEIEAALAIVGSGKERIHYLYKNVPLDGMRIEITIRYTILPAIGHKLTDTHGGKGVITAIWDDERMPRDCFGRVADMIQDPNGTFNRMIPGRKHEQYMCDTLDQMRWRICSKLGIEEGTKRQSAKRKYREIEQSSPERIQECLKEITDIYEIMSPIQAGWIRDWLSSGQQLDGSRPQEDLLLAIVENRATLYFPHDNRRHMPDIIRMIRDSPYRPIRDRVTYVPTPTSGPVLTMRPIRIAPVYIIMLDKIAHDWSACNLSPMGHHGVPTQLSEYMKYREPARIQGVRCWGEAEMRLLAGYCPDVTIAEIMDRNGNPDTARRMGEVILRHPTPTGAETLIDRRESPFGQMRPLAMIRHIFECIGFSWTYRPYQPQWKKENVQ